MYTERKKIKNMMKFNIFEEHDEYLRTEIFSRNSPGNFEQAARKKSNVSLKNPEIRQISSGCSTHTKTNLFLLKYY